MRWILIATLALTGCTANRPGVGHDLESTLWVEAYVDAWEARRGSLEETLAECPQVYDVRVSELPADDVQGWCCPYPDPARCSRYESCGKVLQDLTLGGVRTYLQVIVDEAHEEPLAALVGHEVLHVIRACWAHYALGPGPLRAERFDFGAPPGEDIHRADDAGHQDCPLWRRCSGERSIEYDAQRRLGLEGPR